MSERPPRVFGTLLATLGMLLLAGSAYFYFIAGPAEDNGYFAAVGLGILITGILLNRGRESALHVFAVTLIIVWGWSLSDIGLDSSKLFMRVGFLTIVGIYVFSPRIRSRLGVQDDTPDIGEPLTEAESKSIERLADHTGAILGFVPRALTWLMLLYGAMEMRGMLKQAAGSTDSLAYLLHLMWIVSPFALLGWMSISSRRDFLKDSAMLCSSIMAYLFGIAIYYMNVTKSTRLQDTSVFYVVPLAQIIWASAWMLLLNRKRG